mmetsp:Transcript_22055/g.47744  ORF Transcript_22055/g.47744 Transcript_22055/m.47744 type:complete len:122 (-) Transcript_22055:24-389(-)
MSVSTASNESYHHLPPAHHHEAWNVTRRGGMDSNNNNNNNNRRKGKMEIFVLTAGRSVYEETHDFAPNYPHGLKIQTDAFAKQKKQNTTILLAVMGEGELDIWVVALQEATQQQQQQQQQQ